MERNREGWYEREEVKKITADWVKLNVKLTNREQELLQLVYERKLVRRDHLEIISPSYRKLGINRSVLLNRAIKKMYKSMILDKTHEKQEIGKGSFPAMVSIDKAGSVLLGKPHKRRIIQRKASYRGIEYITRQLPSNVQHINGINKIEVETILFCEESGYRLIEWQLEQPKTFNYNDEKIVLIPDVLLLLEADSSKIVAYIEFDTGSEGIRELEPKIIRDKLLKYKRYKSSQLWLEEDYQKHFDIKVFPLVLFITMDAKRVEYWNRISKEHGVKSIAMYFQNYRAVLSKLIKIMNK